MTTDPTDYCNGEEFSSRCLPHEVVVMETAVYGRMQIGRCVKNDLGFLGCQADVIETMDRKCSGLSQCTFTVTNKEITDDVRCLADLKTYLNVSYSCLKGI